MAIRVRFLMDALVWIGSRRDRGCRRARGRQGRFAPPGRWPEDGPSLTAAVRDGTGRAQVGAEGWCRSNKRMGLPDAASRTLYRVREAEALNSWAVITVMKTISFRSSFNSPIKLCASNSVPRFQTPLLPVESTDPLGNFGDGNKPKTIANRDQKMWQLPSNTMLRLRLTSADPGRVGPCWIARPRCVSRASVCRASDPRTHHGDLFAERPTGHRAQSVHKFSAKFVDAASAAESIGSRNCSVIRRWWIERSMS